MDSGAEPRQITILFGGGKKWESRVDGGDPEIPPDTTRPPFLAFPKDTPPSSPHSSKRLFLGPCGEARMFLRLTQMGEGEMKMGHLMVLWGAGGIV
jgi:hypothetical protein